MGYKLELQQQAIVEIQDAYDWYETQRLGLGDELMEEIEDALAAISEDPERYGYVKTNSLYRRIRVSRFPYMVVYEVEGNVVIVNSVVHFKRDKKFDS